MDGPTGCLQKVSFIHLINAGCKSWASEVKFFFNGLSPFNHTWVAPDPNQLRTPPPPASVAMGNPDTRHAIRSSQ